MTASLATIEKNSISQLDYTFKWAHWLTGGETIATQVFSVSGEDNSLTIHQQDHTATSATVWLDGGTCGKSYTVTCKITTNSSPPRIDKRSIIIAMNITADTSGTLYWGVGISIPTVEADILALVNSEERDNFLRRISIAAASQRLVIAYRAQWGAANVRFVTGGFGIAMVWTTITVAGVLCNVGYSFAANMTFPLQDLEIY